MNAPTMETSRIGDTYAVLARAFAFPAADLWDRLEGKPLRELLANVEAPDALEPLLRRTFPCRSQEEREADFIRTFEFGHVPQYEGLCRKEEGREGLIEEVLRFYHYFGLRLSDAHRDFPDSFVTELEFMQYLVALEQKALEEGRDATSLRTAQFDFLERHLTRWAERLPQVMASRRASDSYRLLAEWVHVFALAHRDALRPAIGAHGIPVGEGDGSVKRQAPPFLERGERQ